MPQCNSSIPSAPDVSILVQPGYASSGDDHWQTHWENAYGYRRIEQTDWLMPQVEDWTHQIELAVSKCPGKVILVAHSLGCIAIAHWAKKTLLSPRIVGALLVAPADVESPYHTPDEVRNFSPIPLSPLGFRSTVIASQNDPFMEMPKSRGLAEVWGAEFVDAGKLGHINSEAKLELWPDGHRHLLDLLVERTDAPSTNAAVNVRFS